MIKASAPKSWNVFGRKQAPKSSRRRDHGDRSTLPLPGIPESPGGPAAPKGLAHFIRRQRSRQMDDLTAELRAQSPALVNQSVESGTASLTAKTKRPRVLKSQISNPELRLHGSFHSGTSLRKEKGASDDLTLPERSPSADSPDCLELAGTFRPKHPTVKDVFRLASPRISPMEYTRMYLIEQAVSEREHRECEIAPPTKQWFWAPYWERFLIVPKIPSTISRDRMSLRSRVRPSANVDPPMEAARKSGARGEGHCPRLSLNFGPSVAGFPSLMDLKLASDSQWDDRDDSPAQHEGKSSHDTSSPHGGNRKLSDAEYPMPPDHPPPPVPAAPHRESTHQSLPVEDSEIAVPESSVRLASDVESTHSAESVETVIHVADAQSFMSEPSELTVVASKTPLGTNEATTDVFSHEADCLADLRPAPLNLTRRMSRHHDSAPIPESKNKNMTTQGLELPRPDSPTIDVPDIRGQVALNHEYTDTSKTFTTRARSPSPGTPVPPRSRQPTYKLVPNVKRTSFIEPASPVLRRKAVSPIATPRAPTTPTVPDQSSEGLSLTQRSNHYVPPFLDTSRNRLALSSETHHKASSERIGRHIPLMRAAARDEDDMQPLSQFQGKSPSQGNAFHLRKRQDTGQATILPSINLPVPISPTEDSRQLYGQPNCNFSFTTRPAIAALGGREPAPCTYGNQPASRPCPNPEYPRTGSGTTLATTDGPKTPSRKDAKPKETRRTPSRLASIFRRREDSVHVHEKTAMSLGPVSPALASPWRPFEESLPDDNVFGATWMYSDDRNWANNEDVIAARRQEMMARQQQGTKRPRRLSFGRAASGGSSNRDVPDAFTSSSILKTEATAELKVEFQHFLQNMPSPPPDTALPPVPSPGTRTPSRTASTRPPRAPSAVYRDKKPKGLGIATASGTTATTTSDARNRLRKASKDSLRSASAASASGSSRLKDVFRIGDRQFSLGKAKEVRSKVDDGEPRSVFEED